MTAAATGVVISIATWYLWLDAPERQRVLEALRRRRTRAPDSPDGGVNP
jgi:hypothetical protein